MEHTGARAYVCLFLTGAFGLRCSEALTLKREDVNLDAAIPKIKVTGADVGNRKSPGDVYVRLKHIRLMKEYLANGIQTTRVIKHKHGKGKKKAIEKKDTFKIPTEGYIFTSRKGAKKAHLHYHAIYDHVVRQAPRFMKHLQAAGEKVSPELGKIRPHSGRATLITELMGEGMTIGMSMKYARHATNSVAVHLRYGQLTLADVKKACDKLDSPSKGKKTTWSNMSTKDLLKAQKGIAAELAKRLK